MVLQVLLEKLNYELINGKVDISVNALIYDSRKVQPGDVFVCIKGAVSDGHQYAEDVAKKGATAIIIQDDIEITECLTEVTIIKTVDTRLALAYMSAAFFGYPAKELFTIGITGTKGKTTTTYMSTGTTRKGCPFSSTILKMEKVTFWIALSAIYRCAARPYSGRHSDTE